MADEYLTLLDVTKRRETDATIGLVEDIQTYAPELATIGGRLIPGTHYRARVRTALKSNGAFRSANEGLNVGSSTYEQKRFDCFFFDSQIRVDEAVLRAATADGDSPEMILADEASGSIRASMISLGAQFYTGTTADAKGFPGMTSFLNSSQDIDAGGSGNTVWLIQASLQGVHFIWGNNNGLVMGDWSRQALLDANSKQYFGMVNNLSGYIGLSCASKFAVGRVKNVDSTHAATDTLIAQCISKFPVGFKPNMILMNRDSAYWLQKSRSFTSITNAAPGRGGVSATGLDVFAQHPTESNGLPIVVTDSITS